MKFLVGDRKALTADNVDHGISLIEGKMRQVDVDFEAFVGDILNTKQVLSPIQ